MAGGAPPHLCFAAMGYGLSGGGMARRRLWTDYVVRLLACHGIGGLA